MRSITAAHSATGSAASRVIVAGSANIDSSVYVESFPRPGETVFGTSAARDLGGKGANQAVVASILGANTVFIGMVGADEGGDLVRMSLARHGVDVSSVHTAPEAATGSAYITVDGAGENTIVVSSGANSAFTPDVFDLPEAAVLFDGAARTVGLTQGELRPETVDAFAELCARHGARFVLNLAPVVAVSEDTLRRADPLIVNESEALALLGNGRAPAGTDAETLTQDEALAAVRRLAGEFSASAVITLGAAGAVIATKTASWHEPAQRPARVVDTTGAGDAFVGALAAALAEGWDLDVAARWGTGAGAAAVTTRGAVGSSAALAALRFGGEGPES